jgi:hypothetical protein
MKYCYQPLGIPLVPNLKYLNKIFNKSIHGNNFNEIERAFGASYLK